jgi:Tol biopolymer transport system component
VSKLSNPESGDWTDELLVGGPEDAYYDWTADGAHVVSLEDAGQGHVRVGWDGRSSEPFELQPQGSGNPFEWSPGALHVAWYGVRNGQLFVAIDGVEHPCEGVTRSVPPTFSDSGGHVAYGVYVDGTPRLMFDGQLLGDWRPAPIRPVFSADGSRFAFVAENREFNSAGQGPRDYRQWVVLDGVAQPETEGIAAGEEQALQFSSDGRHVAYCRLEGSNVRLVVDGTLSDAHPAIEFPTFSPDSRRLAFAAGRPDSLSLVVDGVSSGKAYWRIGPPVFSPDSSRLGFFGARSKGRGVAVVDGVEGAEFSDAWGNLTFSADSRHVAYLAIHRSGGFLSRSMTVNLMRDDVGGAAWDEVSSEPHFSPDSAHVAFSGRRGKHWHAVVDDLPGPAFEQVGPPRFGATGRLGYLALDRDGRGRDRYFVVVDGVEPRLMKEHTGATATESFLFSPDGQHVATAGLIDDWWRPILDDAVGPGGVGAGSVRFENDSAWFLVSGEDGAHRVSTRLSTR